MSPAGNDIFGPPVAPPAARGTRLRRRSASPAAAACAAVVLLAGCRGGDATPHTRSAGAIDSAEASTVADVAYPVDVGVSAYAAAADTIRMRVEWEVAPGRHPAADSPGVVTGVAIDAAGNVYAIDRLNSKIRVFDAHFAPLPVRDVTPEGTVISGDATSYELVETEREGAVVRRFVRNVPLDPIPAHERRDSIAALRARLDSIPVGLDGVKGMPEAVRRLDVPDRYPAYMAVCVGRDGDVWVRRRPVGGGDRTIRPSPRAASATSSRA